MSLKKRLRKAVQTATKPVQNMVRPVVRSGTSLLHGDIKGSLNQGLRGLTGLATLGYSEQYLDSMKRKRQEMNASVGAEEQAMAEQQATLRALQQDALGRYERGEIDPGTKAQIERTSDIKKAMAKERLGQLGIGDSSTAVETTNRADQLRAAELDKARDDELQKSYKAMGLSDAALEAVWGLHESERQGYAQAFATTMEALGNLTMSLVKTGNAGG